MKKLFYIESLGCFKNQVDAEILMAILERLDFTYTEDIAAAHYVIINTCGFIDSAKQESVDEALTLKKQYPDKKFLLTGCLVQRYGKALLKGLPEIEGFMGNRDLRLIQKVVEQVERGERVFVLPGTYFDASGLRGHNLLSYPGSAYVKLAEGCRNNCSYCAIPLIRGTLHSRPQDEVTAEVARLLKRGIREIILIAQDLSSYGLDRGSTELVPLIKKLLKLPHDFWLRLLYIHPDRFPLALLEVVRSDPRILPYFDLPFQHVSPAILKAMGRLGNAGLYLRLLESIRQACSKAVIRSTMLVGFPGESEEDFQALLDFQQQAGINWLGVFSYSNEEGTAAAKLKGQVKKEKALKRKAELLKAQESITAGWLDEYQGLNLDVLVEERVEKESLFLGRGYLHTPDVDGSVVFHAQESKPGDLLKVKILKRSGLDLEGVAYS
jgi:ribosomal protein S12 methylthiotransferase